MKGNLRATLFAFVLTALLSTASGAQAVSEQTELIRTLLNRIDQLEKRVAELEKEKSPKSSEPTPSQAVAPSGPAAAAGHAEDHTGHPQGTPINIEEQIYPKFRMAGFSDVNFAASNQPGAISGFNQGQFVLHINSQLSPRVSFFGEVSLTARPNSDGGLGYVAEVERSFIRYDYNDFLRMSFGRFHTPVNFWNTAFHHGTWLQTTASKPELARSFIPIHFVGALAEGLFPAGGLNLSYNVGLGNGRGNGLQQAGDFRDVNNNRAWLLNVSARPDKLYALQVGASVYRDQGGGPIPFREWIQGVHVVWHKESPEIIAEFANARHQPLGSRTTASSQSWYVQTAWRFPETRWKPYYRFEYQHIPKSDVVFQTVPSLAGSVAGLRWDISNFAAFKFEYRNFRLPVSGRTQYGFVQTSFTF